MDKRRTTLIKPDDAIAAQAYAELLIACQVDGCTHVCQTSLDEPATDPVDRWARGLAERARREGWTAAADGRVLCPHHAPLRDGSEPS
jgi:hypothetical protein